MKSYILTLDTTVSIDALLDILKDNNVKIIDKYDSLHIITVQTTEDKLNTLNKIPGITGISEDSIYTIC